MKAPKLLLIAALVVVVGTFYGAGLHRELTLAAIQENLDQIRALNARWPLRVPAIFVAAYVFLTSLSIPGALVLTLLAGAVFGTGIGTALVSVASTSGATIAFLLSRYLFGEALLAKYRRRFLRLNEPLRRDGNRYLLTLRLIPVSPYVVINVLMGLTGIRTWSFIWITFVGMLPGNLVYVYAGRKLAQIGSPGEILTWPIILLLTSLGFVPVLLQKLSGPGRSGPWDKSGAT